MVIRRRQSAGNELIDTPLTNGTLLALYCFMPSITPLSKTILFVTGAFLANDCWKEWEQYFERHGYHTLSPPWPFKNASPEALRNQDPSSAVAAIRLMGILDYFEGFVKQLPEKPILIGHSLGGLLVQLLLQRGLGTAGVAIHPLPPMGTGRWSPTLMQAWSDALHFFSSPATTYLVPFRKWKQYFTNGRSCEEQKRTYYDWAAPESRGLIKDLLTRKLPFDPECPRPPLLLTAGSRDRLSPPSKVMRSYWKWAEGESLIDYQEFKGLDHLVFGHPGGLREAEFILNWLRSFGFTKTHW